MEYYQHCYLKYFPEFWPHHYHVESRHVESSHVESSHFSEACSACCSVSRRRRRGDLRGASTEGCSPLSLLQISLDSPPWGEGGWRGAPAGGHDVLCPSPPPLQRENTNSLQERDCVCVQKNNNRMIWPTISTEWEQSCSHHGRDIVSHSKTYIYLKLLEECLLSCSC